MLETLSKVKDGLGLSQIEYCSRSSKIDFGFQLIAISNSKLFLSLQLIGGQIAIFPIYRVKIFNYPNEIESDYPIMQLN